MQSADLLSEIFHTELQSKLKKLDIEQNFVLFCQNFLTKLSDDRCSQFLLALDLYTGCFICTVMLVSP